MMKSNGVAVLAALLVLGGCAARAAQNGSDPSRWEGDRRLYAILNAAPLSQSQRDSIAVYEAEHVSATNDLIAEAAEDVHAPIDVRRNALLLLSERAAGTHLSVFRTALDDDDPRVRAMAASAMRRFMNTHPRDAEQLARMALEDPVAEVQAEALHVLSDRDPALLRAYMPRAANAELRTIATDLVRVAESRGAGLVGDGTGVLQRVSPHGFSVTFQPVTRWPQWDAAVGRVTVARNGAAVATIEGVEAVAGVVPVFFSPEGTHIVFERNREIVVRAVDGGAERAVGAGIAPRVLPFTEEFIFVREAADGRTEVRAQTRIRYEVLRASFAGGREPEVIGGFNAMLSYERHGNYSPARWAHVEDRSGYFYLSAEGFEAVFPLPNPFGG
jgi:hypothetical protein